MAKKETKRAGTKDVEHLLAAALSELKALTQAQKKTAKEVLHLKRELKKAKLRKCCEPKKKKKSGKKKRNMDAANTSHNGMNSEGVISDANVAATPVGLLNLVPEPVDGAPDDLKLISGVGPKLEETLNELGIFHFEQIAKWTQPEVDWVDDYLQFSGRIERDNWIGQAKALAKGGRDEYVKVFGKEPI